MSMIKLIKHFCDTNTEAICLISKQIDAKTGKVG